MTACLVGLEQNTDLGPSLRKYSSMSQHNKFPSVVPRRKKRNIFLSLIEVFGQLCPRFHSETKDRQEHGTLHTLPCYKC